MLNRKMWLSISSVLVLIGAVGIVNIFIQGEHVMGTSNYVPWGSLIAAYVFFVAISTGLTFLSSLAHVFKWGKIEVMTKRLTLASIVTLMMGFVMIGVELGSPLSLFYILISPNLQAPIFWMGLLYGIYMALHIVEFFFQLKEDHGKIKIISPIVLVVAIAAQGTLGAVFGMSIARGYWNESYISIYFILLAFVSGLAFAILMTVILTKTKTISESDKQKILVLQPIFSKMLIGLLIVTVFFNIWKWFYSLYGNMPGKAEAALLMVGGPLTIPYWVLEVGLVFVLPIIVLFAFKQRKQLSLTIASISMLIGFLAMRIIMVFAGQIVPLTVVQGSESTNQLREFGILWSEWATMGFGVGGTILLYLIAERLFDLNVAPHKEERRKRVNTGEGSYSLAK
ncbi:respiratory selenite reductase subunit SrrC [Salipaludibacillus daqingensis]|uniref:respiratory selenite reductase subunit SrrC n=1 Tax=Salipaludibacillus daqingensis TaxID=3041001 RepID=UPI002475B674|nr:respiratory selenite reductase subunit SrrC [Salipaludibacillus daqingensis]